MKTNRCIPSSAIISEIAYPDVGEGAAWLAEAFGFQLRIRIGNHRIQMMLGDSAIVVTERRGDDTSRTSTILRVHEADAYCARAVALGAKIVRAPESYPYGERQGQVEDFAGNRWILSQTIADCDPRDFGFEAGPAFVAQ